MNNPQVVLDLLKCGESYWVGSQAVPSSTYGLSDRNPDNIILFARPSDMPVLEEPDTMTYRDLRMWGATKIVANIYLSEPDWPPFQLGLCLDNFETVYPLTNTPINEFIEKAKALKSHKVWEYTQLAKDLQPVEPVRNVAGNADILGEV